MKRLCCHIADIYRRELARGNTLTCVRVNTGKTLPAKHTVYFDRPLGVYETEGKDLMTSVNTSSRFDVRYRGYICLKCGCNILGRLQEDQQEWYEADPFVKPSEDAPKIIATPMNIYWSIDEASPLLCPVERGQDEGDPAPERHPDTMQGYYDMGVDAFPDFAVAQSDFQSLADTLLARHAAEKKQSGARLTVAAVSSADPHQWSMLFDDGTKQAPHVFGDRRDMTPTEAKAYEAVSRAFLSCKYGRLHQINVRKGQVSFTTIPGYAVIYTVSGKPPTDILPLEGSGLYVNIEKLADRWYQRTYWKNQI